MAIEFGKGITLAGGFDLGAKSPLDSRLTVATIEERDAHVTNNRAYDGMLVFVEADKITYQYILDNDGNGEWKEFGFNEADFVAHVANDLVTDDASMALSAAQGVVLKGLIDAEAAKSDEADENLQVNIDTLDAKIGVVPEGSNTVIAYVNSKAQEVLDAATGGSSESAASVKLQLDNYIAENNPKVTANATAAAEAKAAADDAMAHSEGVDARVDVLVGDDSDKSVRTIANEELAKQLIAEGAQESLDTLAEIAAWIQSHPDDASAMNKAIEDLETLVGALPEGVTATTIIGYVQEVVAAETSARETAIDGLDVRLQAVEGKFGDGEGNVESQIASAVAVETAAREAADVQNLADSKAYTDEKIATEVSDRNSAIATAKEEAISEAGTNADAKDEVVLQAAKDYADSKVAGVDLTGIATNAENIANLQSEVELKASATDLEAANNKITALEDEVAKIGDVEEGKSVVQMLEEVRIALDSKDAQVETNAKNYADEKDAEVLEAAKADATEKVDAVNAIIGTVEENKTVIQMLNEARESAVASANEYTDAEIGKISATVASLSETHANEVKALQDKDVEIEGNVSTLQEKVTALESVEHVEISNEEIENLF